MSKTLGIIDYGVGNLANVERCLAKINSSYKIARISSADKVASCDKLILPGVGAFGAAIYELKARNLDSAIYDFVSSGKYMLGICLGAQLLFDTSYEFGTHSGLGIIKGEIIKFSHNLKIPHVGWNKNFIRKDNSLLLGVQNGFYLYFVHSYHIVCDEKYILATCDYGNSFPSIVSYNNVFGIQAHPERSHEIGFSLLRNFMSF